MDITPSKLHQKTPLILGSCEDVRDCELFIQEKHQAVTAERRLGRHEPTDCRPEKEVSAPERRREPSV